MRRAIGLLANCRRNLQLSSIFRTKPKPKYKRILNWEIASLLAHTYSSFYLLWKQVFVDDPYWMSNNLSVVILADILLIASLLLKDARDPPECPPSNLYRCIAVWWNLLKSQEF